MDSVIQREIWKDIPGYETYYQVSNLGRVRRLKFCNNVVKDKPCIKYVTPLDNGNGYYYVELNLNGKGRHFYIHRLVAGAFCEKTGGEVVNHIDYNKSNNRADNLEWTTQKANTAHSRIHMYKRHKVISKVTGEHHIGMRNGKYRVNIKGYKERYFTLLQDAIKYRDEVLSIG